MTFTDDKLNRLKEFLSATPFPEDWENIKALIARLEVAEGVCHAAEELAREDRNLNALIEAVNVWRKVVGK